MFLVSKKVEKHQFLVKRGVATKRVFVNNPCFAKCEKLSFFLPDFLAKFWLMVKQHYKKVFQHIFKSKKKKQMTSLKGYYLGQVRVITWAKFVAT